MKTEDIKKMGLAYLQVQEGTKFIIPEDIPMQDNTAFHAAAANAHKAGQSHFNFNGKKYPVTMKKDAATQIADDVKEKKDDEEVVMNPVKKDKKNEKGTETSMAESTRPVLARILEKRADKYKSATDPEKMSDKFSGKGAQDAAASVGMDTQRPIAADDEKGHEDAVKAGRVGPTAKARSGDNKAGDKAIIKSATAVKQ